MADTQQTYDQDNIEEFQNEKTSHKLPIGWLILLVCLLAFAVYYVIANSPGISGWSQNQAYEESLKEQWYTPK